MTLILALDLATKTGWARGRIGEAPQFGSVRFGHASSDQNVIFGAALHWCSKFLAAQLPDALFIEALLPPQAMINKTSRQVRDRLAGLHGIIRAVAQLRGVERIEQCKVGDVRSHFINGRGLKRERAKGETMLQCRALGWNAADDNQGDALALWSYACALVDPVTAIKTVPLFNRALVL